MLTVSSSVGLSGTAFFKIDNSPGGTNDVIVSSGGAIAYGGTLQVTNTSANAFTNGESFQLFSAGTYLPSLFTNIVPAQPGKGLFLGYPASLPTNGTLAITNVPLTPVVWDGRNGSNWNFAEADWRPVSGPPDTVYVDGDTLIFDDTLSTGRNIINISSNVQPHRRMTFGNSLTNTYTFIGSGGIAGNAGLTLQVQRQGDSGQQRQQHAGFYLATITFGTLQIGNNDTNGSLFADITNISPGMLVFDRTDNLSYESQAHSPATARLFKVMVNILTITGTPIPTFTEPLTFCGARSVPALSTRSAPAATRPFSSLTAPRLDFNGVPGTNFVTVSGAGVSNNGAIVNNGFFPALPGLSYLTMTGDTTLGGLQRWDLRNDALLGPGATTTNYSYLSTGGHPYNLAKVGPNVIGLASSAIDPALANIDVKAGTLDYEGTTDSLGNPTNVLTVETGATLELYNTSNALNKVIVFQGGSTNLNASGTNIIIGPVTLSSKAAGAPGTVTFNIGGTSQLLTNIIRGPGNLIVTGGQPLYLSASNTYTGSTLVATSTVVLVNTGSIGYSSTVTVSSNATINARFRGDQTFTVPSGQTLQGGGNITGFLSASAGSTVAPGTSAATGVLTASSNVTLSGTALFKVNNISGGTNDVLVSQSGSITYGGTLQISNMTTNVFTKGQSFKLFSAAGGYSGLFANLVPFQPGTGLIWNTNSLATNGTLSIATGSAGFTFFNISGTNLVLSGTNGIAGGEYIILSSTNLTQPWVPFATNNFNSSGDFNFVVPISLTNQQQFFIIEQP